MEKYISEIVKSEDITIKTNRSGDVFLVEVHHLPTSILVEDESEISQIDAYNKCIKSIEWIIEFKKFRNEYKRIASGWKSTL